MRSSLHRHDGTRPARAAAVPDLVADACRGDHRAWAELTRMHDPAVRRVVRAMHGAEQVDDVVQQVWLQAYEQLEQLRDPTRLRPWLEQIAARTVYRTTARARREVPVETLDGALPSAPSAEQLVIDAEDAARAVRAYEGLSGRDRDLIDLRVLRENSVAQTASVLGWTTAAVHTGTSRARAALTSSYQRLSLLVPPVVASFAHRRRHQLELPAQAGAVFVAGVIVAIAPVVPQSGAATPEGSPPAWAAMAPQGVSHRVVDAADTAVSHEADPATHGDTATATSSVDAGNAARVPTGPGDGGENVLPLDTPGPRVTKYDGDYSEQPEPDFTIGSDEIGSVRLWPYQYLPVDTPDEAPSGTVDPTDPDGSNIG